MGRLCETDGLTEDQTEILKAVRTFVDEQIIPVATELEHADEYPQEIVDGLKELGIFGLTIPEEYDGLGESLLTYALCVEEIARGWMSVSGVINTHFIVAYMLMRHGTDEQKKKYLPKMATGEVRGAFSMSEPGLGSDVAAIKTKAVKDGDDWSDQRPEDVADQRRHVQPGRHPGSHGRGGGVAVQVHDHLPRREGGGVRRDRARPDHPRQARQDGLQGRRHHRGDLRGLQDHRRPDPGRGDRPGLLPDDGRRRGRPRQRRRARLRHRQPRLRARDRLQPAARDLRQADQPSTRRSCSGSRRWRPRSRPRTR